MDFTVIIEALTKVFELLGLNVEEVTAAFQALVTWLQEIFAIIL